MLLKSALPKNLVMVLGFEGIILALSFLSTFKMKGRAQGPCIRELHGLEHQVSQALLTGSVKTQSRNRCSELVGQDCLPHCTLHVPIRLTSEGFFWV